MLQVDADALEVAAGGQVRVGADLESVCRSMRIAVELLDAGCGDVQLSCAAGEFGRRWVAAISASATGVEQLGGRLATAGVGYARTEAVNADSARVVS